MWSFAFHYIMPAVCGSVWLERPFAILIRQPFSWTDAGRKRRTEARLPTIQSNPYSNTRPPLPLPPNPAIHSTPQPFSDPILTSHSLALCFRSTYRNDFLLISLVQQGDTQIPKSECKLYNAISVKRINMLELKVKWNKWHEMEQKKNIGEIMETVWGHILFLFRRKDETAENLYFHLKLN